MSPPAPVRKSANRDKLGPAAAPVRRDKSSAPVRADKSVADDGLVLTIGEILETLGPAGSFFCLNPGCPHFSHSDPEKCVKFEGHCCEKCREGWEFQFENALKGKRHGKEACERKVNPAAARWGCKEWGASDDAAYEEWVETAATIRKAIADSKQQKSSTATAHYAHVRANLAAKLANVGPARRAAPCKVEECSEEEGDEEGDEEGEDSEESHEEEEEDWEGEESESEPQYQEEEQHSWTRHKCWPQGQGEGQGRYEEGHQDVFAPTRRRSTKVPTVAATASVRRLEVVYSGGYDDGNWKGSKGWSKGWSGHKGYNDGKGYGCKGYNDGKVTATMKASGKSSKAKGKTCKGSKAVAKGKTKSKSKKPTHWPSGMLIQKPHPQAKAPVALKTVPKRK